MDEIKKELNAIVELNRTTRTAEAETKLRTLFARLPRHQLVRHEHSITQLIAMFLPKRRKALERAFAGALAHRPKWAAAPAIPDGIKTSRAEGEVPPPTAPPKPAAAPTPPVPKVVGMIDVEDVVARMSGLSNDDERDRAVRELAIACLQASGSEVRIDEDALQRMFDPSLSSATKRAILAVAVRALPRVPWLREITTVRLGLMKMFDETWQHDVYAALGITASMQTHEKWARIEDKVRELPNQLVEMLAGMSSLNMFSTIRQDLKKILNSALARATIWPLVQKDLVTLRLDGVLSTVAEYIESDATAAFEARSRAKDSIHEYVSHATDASGHIAGDTLTQIIQRLEYLLEDDFASSPVSKPANVLVKPSPKKYPFDAIGAACEIGVVVACEGPGHAFDVELTYAFTENLSTDVTRQYLGNLQPSQVVEGIVLPCTIVAHAESTRISGSIRWTNHGQQHVERDFAFNLDSQAAGIDWSALATLDPYSLEPVTEERELVGRTEILNQLVAKTTAKAVGSFFVFGQKRVGKTSLVRSLQSRLQQEHSTDFAVVYLDSGDFVHPEADQTIQRLGARLCEEIRDSDRRLASVPVPTFSGALAPMDTFLRSVLQIIPTYRVLFILDEFDELPVQMYRRGAVGDAFFLTLRSISAKAPFGFVLVGGEKMEFILSTQGDVLNKFQSLRVDYFDREKHWSDFKDLVRQPTAGWLEISDDALVALYEASAGNPFFAKLLCDELYRLMVQRRDAHVTPPEVREAVRRALAKAGSNRFAHFWEDGIFEETGDKVEERSIARRHILLALADGLRRGPTVPKTALIASARREDLREHDTEAELAAFERRQVLECPEGNYRCKVGLFGEWLRDRGVQEIVTTFTDRTSLLERREREERERVSEAELQVLSAAWGHYKGKIVGPETIRSWLGQFSSVGDQKLMFSLLKNIRFYSTGQVRERMHEAQGIVERRLADRMLFGRLEAGQRKRRDIIVSHLGGVAKSGVRYGQLYADENGLFSEMVVERDRLGRSLTALANVNAVVLVDDFIGSGQSAVEAFRALSEADCEALRAENVVVVYVVVCGFESGRARLESALDKLRLPVHVHLCDPLVEADRCFSDNSRVFPDETMRIKARDIASSYGQRLVKNAPLGYSDCQALVVFDTNCPNNTLPILWASRDGWQPLFRRQ